VQISNDSEEDSDESSANSPAILSQPVDAGTSQPGCGRQGASQPRVLPRIDVETETGQSPLYQAVAAGLENDAACNASDSLPSANESVAELVPGARVEMFGLQKRPELNTIDSVEHKNRYTWNAETGQRMMAANEGSVVVAAAAAAAAATATDNASVHVGSTLADSASQYYGREHNLCTCMPDGFYDPGRDRCQTAVPSLKELQREPVAEQDREIIIVDSTSDEELADFVTSAREKLRHVQSFEERVKILAIAVSNKLGGQPDAAQTSPDDQCEAQLRALKLGLGSNVIPIGKITNGVCRHRAVLFKYVGDRVLGEHIECRLVRGDLRDDEEGEDGAHGWNTVRFDGKCYVVDVMNVPGVLIDEDSQQARDYKRSTSARGGRRRGCGGRSLASHGDRVLGEHVEFDQPEKKLLGEGTFGKVFRSKIDGWRTENGATTVAVKVSKGPVAIADAQQEIKALRRLSHDRIVRFYDVFFDARKCYIVLEYCAGKSLYDRLHPKFDEHNPLTFTERQLLLQETAAAIRYLHEKSMVHRDVKTENILLTAVENPHAKLADFGLARLSPSGVGGSIDTANGGACTPAYAAPEQKTAGGRVTSKADIFSFGKVVHEVLTNVEPGQDSPSHATDQILKLRAELFEILPMQLEPLWKLIDHCTQLAPEKRPAAEELCKILNEGVADDQTEAAKAARAKFIPCANLRKEMSKLDSQIDRKLKAYRTAHTELYAWEKHCGYLVYRDIYCDRFVALQKRMLHDPNIYANIYNIKNMAQAWKETVKIKHDIKQILRKQEDIMEGVILKRGDAKLFRARHVREGKERRNPHDGGIPLRKPRSKMAPLAKPRSRTGARKSNQVAHGVWFEGRVFRKNSGTWFDLECCRSFRASDGKPLPLRLEPPGSYALERINVEFGSDWVGSEDAFPELTYKGEYTFPKFRLIGTDTLVKHRRRQQQRRREMADGSCTRLPTTELLTQQHITEGTTDLAERGANGKIQTWKTGWNVAAIHNQIYLRNLGAVERSEAMAKAAGGWPH
jgi:serine/threonine protein kinase